MRGPHSVTSGLLPFAGGYLEIAHVIDFGIYSHLVTRISDLRTPTVLINRAILPTVQICRTLN